jgi:hypothetical protein
MSDRTLSAKDSVPSLFIEGYLTDRFAAGDLPTYGFPKNHLPETTGGQMQVVTGFLASGSSKQK